MTVLWKDIRKRARKEHGFLNPRDAVQILSDADALLTMVPVLQKLAEVDEEDGALANVLIFNDEARIPKQIIIDILDTFAVLPEHLKG